MMKWLLTALAVFAAWLLFKRHRAEALANKPKSEARSKGRDVQNMVACEYCSLHVPQADAKTDAQGRHYCSAEHLKLSQ
jgi:uncharacterized protein